MRAPNAEPVGVFVYGTLRQDQSAFSIAREAGWVEARPAAVRGFRLYGLPLGWPAAVRVGSEASILGELHTFADLERALAVLDGYEEVDHEFHRETTLVYPVRGEDLPDFDSRENVVTAWIYAYPTIEAVCSAGGRPIPGGWWPGSHDYPGHSPHEL